jgi:hypothetical protein
VRQGRHHEPLHRRTDRIRRAPGSADRSQSWALTALRRPRTLAVIAAAVAFAAAALFLAVVLLGDDGEPSPGPLGTDEVQSSGFSHEVGRDFTFGLPVAFNRGDKPAVLERISLIDPTPRLKVIATRVAGPDRRMFSSQPNRTGPPREITDLHPVRGSEVAPQDKPDGDRGVRTSRTGRCRGHCGTFAGRRGPGPWPQGRAESQRAAVSPETARQGRGGPQAGEADQAPPRRARSGADGSRWI